MTCSCSFVDLFCFTLATFFFKCLIFVVLGVAPRPLEHEEEIVPAQPPFSRNMFGRISLQRIYDYLIEEYLFNFAVKNMGKR